MCSSRKVRTENPGLAAVAFGKRFPYDSSGRIIHKGVSPVTAVDVSNVSPGLFVLGAVFILLIFSLLSLGVLRMFQQRFRAGWFCFAGSVASAVVMYILLDIWYI